MSNDREINEAAESVTVNQAFGELYAYLVDTGDRGDADAGWARLRHAIEDQRIADSAGGEPSTEGMGESQCTPPADGHAMHFETVESARSDESAIQPRKLDYLDGAAVYAAGHIEPKATMPAHYRVLRQACAQPRLISDVAAELGWPPASLRELVDDMADLGLVIVCPRAVWPGDLSWTAADSAGSHAAAGATSGAWSTTDTTTFAKIIIAGGGGTGKTALISSLSHQRYYVDVSDIAPTFGDPAESLSADSPRGRLELGRINLANDLALILFAAPNYCMRHRIYDEWVRGAIGALVLVDPQRLEDSFDAIDYFQSRNLPFAVAITEFDRADTQPIETIREALQLDKEVPILSLSGRPWHSGRQALVTLTQYALHRVRSEESADEGDIAQTQARVLVSLQGAG